MPILLHIANFAQNISQYYFVFPNLYKILPIIIFKIYTKYFSIFFYTTKFIQNTSQYYFVLQNLHKILPKNISYYKTCTKYFPIQNTSQYYFVLRNSHKILPNTTSYYKTFTKYFPKIFHTIKFL